MNLGGRFDNHDQYEPFSLNVRLRDRFPLLADQTLRHSNSFWSAASPRPADKTNGRRRMLCAVRNSAGA